MKEEVSEKSQSCIFGILCNSPVLEKWQAETINQLIENGHQLHLVVLNDNLQEKQSKWNYLKSYPYKRFVFRLWNRFFFRPTSKASVDISGLFKNMEVLHCQTHAKGVAQYFSANDVQHIKELKLDFLLRFGFNIIRGDILKAATYGVWSFHHDDEMIVRGGPPGFWEVYSDADVNGVILQQLTDSLDKGMILKKIFLPVIKHSYKSHLDQLYFQSTKLPSLVCHEILSGNFSPQLSVSTATILHPPGNFKMLFFFKLMIYRRIKFHVNDLFLQEDWNIGLINASINAILLEPEKKLASAYWFPKPNKSVYLADPFVFKFKEETYLFAEQFEYRSGKGQLVVSKASENFSTFRSASESNFHFSFPFLFEYESELFCVPECFESDGVQLYRFDTEKQKLVHERCLLEGYRAIDPVLFQHKGHWWLIFTTKDLPSVNLFAFYADTPFGPFKAHAANPIKSDIRSARNAGIPFIHNGHFLRPAQDCSGHYGKAIVINEIIELSPTTYKEELYQRLEPLAGGPFSSGLHTLNSCVNYTVIDGKRFVFTFAGLRHQLLLKLRKR